MLHVLTDTSITKLLQFLFFFTFLHCNIFQLLHDKHVKLSHGMFTEISHLIRGCHAVSPPCLSAHVSSVVLLAERCSGMRLPCRCHICECVRSQPRQQTHEARECRKNHAFLSASTVKIRGGTGVTPWHT